MDDLQPPGDIGKFLKDQRKAAGLSLTDISKGIGMPRTTLCQIERGAQAPSYGRVYEIYSYIQSIKNKL